MNIKFGSSPIYTSDTYIGMKKIHKNTEYTHLGRGLSYLKTNNKKAHKTGIVLCALLIQNAIVYGFMSLAWGS